MPEGAKFQILAPIVRGRKGEYRKELLEMRRAGYVRARIDGKLVDLGDDISLDKQKKHTIEVIVDRLVMKAGDALARRLADSIETSLRLSSGLVGVLMEDGASRLYSEKLACIRCGVSYPEIRRAFSPSTARTEPALPVTESGMRSRPGVRRTKISPYSNYVRSARAQD